MSRTPVTATWRSALYNAVLAGMAEDGKSFFYVNPLEVLPEASRSDARKRHVKPVRQKWFGCACCPPNLARLIASLGEYCCTEKNDTFFIHQYIGLVAQSSGRKIVMSSDYIGSGRVQITADADRAFTLALRIPSWSPHFTANRPYTQKNGYAYFLISEKTELEIAFDLRPRLICASNLVRADIGRVAVMRGPLVYCAESVDNGENLQLLSLRADTAFEQQGEFLLADGFRERENTALYSEYRKPERQPCKIRLLPYYRWGNRGENEMQVFLRVAEG